MGPRLGIPELAVVDRLMETVVFVEPLRVTSVVAGLQLARAGAPAQEIVMDCVDPFSGVRVNVKDVLWPGFIVCFAGAAATEKSGRAFTVWVRAVETLAAKLEF